MSDASEAKNAFTIAAYMRVTSLAIAAYELNAKATPNCFSISAVLYALLRFVSICTLTVSSVGFFYGGFTLESCSRFFLLPPAFKGSELFLHRTYAPSDPGLCCTFSSAGDGVAGYLGNPTVKTNRLASASGLLDIMHSSMGDDVVPENAQVLPLLNPLTLFMSFLKIAKVGDIHDLHQQFNCRAVNQGKTLGAWIFYAIAMIYDVLTTSVSVGYLLKYKFISKNSVMTKLSKMMLYDGLGYLIVLIGVNILNLVLFRQVQDIQTAGYVDGKSYG
ncbi:hypothetical protein NLJ89_g8741 [Agrocybe chaxingu]|uniref:Uncharacterized protein n=1 Tax=Agrocybe chaxingu TaxID=84603 RepID=A0A9W8JUV4_9AGAR|nr:hypothetical protein NLJ89_g8741 [Agrocybe chaxingu]